MSCRGCIMANRRMFSIDVVGTDKFLDLPISAQCLYFHLGMRADDDGFISSPKQIVKMLACTQGDMKVLAESGYIIPFENGLIVIKHWRQNNYLRRDRYTKSSHVEELGALTLKNGVYDIGIPCGIPLGDADKIRLDKNSIDNSNINITVCPELEKTTPSPSGILLPLNDGTYYDVPLDKLAMWEETYPAVNVESELRKMIAWLDSNPVRRKTKKGIARFINSWLSKEQDRGGIYRNARGQQAPNPEAYNLQHEYQDMYDKHLGNVQPNLDDPFQ